MNKACIGAATTQKITFGFTPQTDVLSQIEGLLFGNNL
jgi:hypothetical protein